VPKRPPRLRVELAAPPDLVSHGVALQTERGALHWADCLDFLKGLPSSSVRLVVADPPYAIAKESWDEFPSEEAYVEWCDQWLAEVHRVLLDDGTAYVCGFSEILAEVKARSAKRFAGGCRWLVWSYKNKANLGGDWGRSHESIIHLRKSRKFVMNTDDVRVPYNDHTRRYPARVQAVSSQYGGGVRRDRWEPHPLGAKPRDVLVVPTICNGMAEKTPHPTQKPSTLISMLIKASSNQHELVIDPFVGSGTTLIVADALDRRWAGADADARYVGLARERLTASGATRRNP
jgi:site-specific DNA-methyltransferase (adenine-specific)